jgi:hypothetical protein
MRMLWIQQQLDLADLIRKFTFLYLMSMEEKISSSFILNRFREELILNLKN